jgi:transposase
MINVGVDLHKTQMTVCYLTDDDEVSQKVYRTDQAGYEGFCTDLSALSVPRKKIRVGVETTGNVWFFVKKVEGHVGEVRVVNTMKFKVIVSLTSKTDRRDARTIAEYLLKDMLPTVTLPDADSRMIAKYVKVRDRYVKLATRLKNQLHALFAEEGICLKTADLSSDIRLRELKTSEVTGEVRFLIEGLVEEVISLKARIRELERKMKDMTREDSSMKLLQSIPGTGIVNASAVRGIIADVERFDDPKKMAAYAGLVPWVSNSNETIRHGHITKRGSTILRNAMVQMAMGMIRYWASGNGTSNMPLYNWYKHIEGRTSGGKSKIALARKMTHIVWAMLKYGHEFSCTLAIPSRAG